MRRERLLAFPLHRLASALAAVALLISGCGGSDEADDPAQACAANAGECPNICEYGTGVDGETCGGTTDCGCGLFCKGGTCSPYEGVNAGCACEPLAEEGDASSSATGGDAANTNTGQGEADSSGPSEPVDDCPTLKPENWICNPYCQTGCGEGQACTFSGGGGSCAPPGTADMGEACSGTSCMAGHACIQFTGDPGATCRRFCQSDADCGDDRKCNLTVNGMFTVCSEPTIGCDLFADPATACAEGQGCYYNNQTSQCMPAGTKQGGDAVEGTCIGGDATCMSDAQCTTCEGYVADADAKAGVCLGTEKVCNSNEECQQCEGYQASAAEDILGACADEAAAACSSDAECEEGVACEGFIAAGTEVMGACSDAMDPPNACMSNADCTQMCEGLIAATNEVPGVCAYDGVTECTAANPCVSSCDGALAGGQGEVCSTANDCVPGLQCLVVCTDICSLDGSAGLPCASCPVESMSINADNNMGICINENVPAACNLYDPANSGCGPGEACYSLRGGHGCLSAGTQVEGTECKFSNDCSAGNLCINSMCLEACDRNAAEGSPESCGVKCNGTEPGSLTPAIWGIGFCKDAPPAEPCSFWEQDCTGGKVCYGTVLGEACMTPEGTAAEGAGCTRNQDCAPGLVCPSSNSPNAGMCTRPCSVVIPDFDGSMSECSSHSDCALPESCIGTKCAVPYCADDCPGAAAEPVTTDSQIGTCNSPL